MEVQIEIAEMVKIMMTSETFDSELDEKIDKMIQNIYEE